MLNVNIVKRHKISHDTLKWQCSQLFCIVVCVCVNTGYCMRFLLGSSDHLRIPFTFDEFTCLVGYLVYLKTNLK